MDQKKFGSPKLDTPNSRYKFVKFATKTRKKQIKKNQISNQELQLGTPGLCTHGG